MPEQVIIVQPTEFCNINCQYCYLPNRSSRNRMTDNTLENIFKAIFDSQCLQQDFSIVWHAGEPLTMPVSFYRSAFETADKYNNTGKPVNHSIQTNAILISDAWCQLFKEYNVDIGVSIDGPQHIHDRNRVTWNGKGTFSLVLRGISLLKQRQIPFGAISVLTHYSMDYADEIYDFFSGLGCQDVSFNIDEIVGSNNKSSMQADDSLIVYKTFMRRLYWRAKKDRFKLKISNFAEMHTNILNAPISRHVCTKPFQIISFDWQGNVSTFSPDLLTWHHPEYQFTYGNVAHDTVDDMVFHSDYRRVISEIEKGIESCQEKCEFFSLCGGGDPSSKLGEFNTMAIDEHLRCQFVVKALADVVLTELEKDFSLLENK